jgi:N-methylhydantoinase A/oxoprolinase/acetone carboxylase beta subunit
VRGTGETDKPTLPRVARIRPRVARPAALRSARFDGRSVRTGFHRWPDLSPGAQATGPAVITGGEATVVVPPGAVFRVDAYGNIVIAVGRRR